MVKVQTIIKYSYSIIIYSVIAIVSLL